jgi:hypothetical protein
MEGRHVWFLVRGREFLEKSSGNVFELLSVEQDVQPAQLDFASESRRPRFSEVLVARSTAGVTL